MDRFSRTCAICQSARLPSVPTYTVNAAQLWCIIQICLFHAGSICWVGNSWLCVFTPTVRTHPTHICFLKCLFIYLFFLSSRTHRLTDSYEFSCFAATAGLVLIWSRPSSIGTTKLRRHSQQNSLQKRSTDSSVFIPKPWQNCTPPYSWPNYPGLL